MAAGPCRCTPGSRWRELGGLSVCVRESECVCVSVCL